MSSKIIATTTTTTATNTTTTTVDEGATCDDRSYRQLALVHKQLTKKDATATTTTTTTTTTATTATTVLSTVITTTSEPTATMCLSDTSTNVTTLPIIKINAPTAVTTTATVLPRTMTRTLLIDPIICADAIVDNVSSGSSRRTIRISDDESTLPEVCIKMIRCSVRTLQITH